MEVVTDAYRKKSQQQQRDALILRNTRLVRHIVGKLVAQLPPGTDVENLEAAGTLGLVEAANRFDASRGTRFETFAYYRIRGAIIDELRRNCPIPQELLERLAKVRAVYQELPAPVAIEVLVEKTGLSHDDVVECLAAIRMTRTVSWDELATLNRLEFASSRDRPDEQAQNAERKQLLRDALMHLDERRRLIVTLYYLENLRLKEIGAVVGGSESKICRQLKEALHVMQEYIRAREA
jgi:RNA polymerase sigma factor for flagellar operon FliA